jgi:hypothetical protein
MYDATRVLHEFACCVAEAALLLAEVRRRALLARDRGEARLAARRD